MAYATEVAADSPLAWFRMDASSGTSETDNTGNGHTGTYTGTPTLNVTGALLADTDKAVTFVSASSQKLTADVLGTLGSNALTSSYEFWIKTTTTNAGTVFGTVNTGTTMLLQVALNSDNTGATSVGKTMFGLRDNAGVLQRAHITTNIYDGKWHHVVWVVASATTYTTYVDGVSVSNSISANTLGTMANFGFAMTVAAFNVRGTVSSYVDATLDEVAFYTSRLSGARVAVHFAAGRTALQTCAATSTGTAVVARQAQEAKLATSTATALRSQLPNKLLAALSSASASWSKPGANSKTLAATATATASVVRAASKAWSATSTASAAVVRRAQRTWTATATATAVGAHAVARAFRATATATASALPSHTRTKTLSASVTWTAVLTRLKLRQLVLPPTRILSVRRRTKFTKLD